MAEYTECEALLAYIEDYACNVCQKYRSDYNKLRCEYCAFGFCIDGINKYKTADVKPVVHGHWESLYWAFDYYCCSECGFEQRLEEFPYCPNCGAKMDGERREDGSNCEAKFVPNNI